MLEQELAKYDEKFFAELAPILEIIKQKSKALASNLLDCIIQLQKSDRYLKASQGFNVAIKESDLKDQEFEIFRKYVRLLRSCTIICDQETSGKFKTLFWDFFAGARLVIAQKHANSKN
ncbi:MAG: hypothetical protein LW817_00550 [Candidatus Caenarcaniphilales bacterium]|jgi:hypothetical protein|nr:hypothetical protein [Candidatus Caenarcaniphilales bacterium]